MSKSLYPFQFGLYLLTILTLVSGCRYYRKFTELQFDNRQLIHFEQHDFIDPDSSEIAQSTFSIRGKRKLLIDNVEVAILDSSLKEVFTIQTSNPIIRTKLPEGRYTIKLSHWDHHSLKLTGMPLQKGQSYHLFLGMRKGYGKEDMFYIH